MNFTELFTFTKQERRGIMTFLVLTTIVILIAQWWPVQYADHDQDYSQYYLPDDSLDIQEANDDIPFWYENTKQSEKKPNQKFRFDPNNICYDSLLLLGFSKYGAKSLTNFTSKGGRVYDSKKFKTIFGIDTNLVNVLIPYIDFPKEKEETKQNPNKKEIVTVHQEMVELNSADSTTLNAIKGVGPFMVKRLLNYRQRLGGYLSLNQIDELNILHDSIFGPVKQYFYVDPTLIKKLNLNKADYKTLIKHPYLTQDAVNAILKYRKQNGPFADVKHISRIVALKEEVGNKISPYLTVEE